MAINKINSDILSRSIIQERVKEATSGKKEKVDVSKNETKKVNLQDSAVFSKDAKKLQETEVILQNALQKLHEMDEVNHQKIAGIQDKINSDFYLDEDIINDFIDDIIPEEEIRKNVSARMQAKKFLPEIKKLDNSDTISNDRIEEIRSKISSGFYNSKEITEKIADEMLSISEI